MTKAFYKQLPSLEGYLAGTEYFQRETLACQVLSS